MPEGETPSPSEQVARLYEQAESQAAKAGEKVVGTGGFASVLGQLAENSAAMIKLGNDTLDLVLRNLRLAGRRDITRLARQLGRNEDKLERVLQELEEVRDQLERQGSSRSSSRRSTGRSNGSSRRSGGRANGSSRSSSSSKESQSS